MDDTENDTEPDNMDDHDMPAPVRKDYLSSVVMALIFSVAIILGLALSPIYTSQGMKAFENEDAVVNPLLYIVFIIVFTIIVLFVVKKGKRSWIKYFFLGAIFFTIINVISPVLDGAVYGVGEDWGEENYSDELAAWDTVVLNGKEYDFCVYAEGRFAVYSDGAEIYSRQVGIPQDGRADITVLPFSSAGGDDAAAIAVNGAGVHLFTVEESENIIHRFSAPGNVSSYFFDSLRTDNFTFTSCVMDNSGNNSALNLTAMDLGMSSAGKITVSSPRSIKYTLNNIKCSDGTLIEIKGENVTTALLIPGKNHEFKVCLSGNDVTYIFDLPGMDNCSTVQFPSILGSTYILGDDGINELLLYNRERFEVFSLSDNSVVSIAKKVMDENIDDLVVAKGIKGDDTEAVYVLSDGRVHLFGPDDWDKGFGYTEERQKGASRLSVGDADGDDRMELALLTGNSVRKYEISPVERHIWVWAVGAIAALVLVGAIRFYPEWFVVDSVGILVAVGAIALIGISLAILPSLLLLVILAVYDAISVYKTKHMIDLADGVMEMRLPVLLVIPKDGKYSFREQKKLTEQLDTGEPRGAMFMGLGDIIIPGILVVSAFTYLPEGVLFGVSKALFVALGALVGGLLGFVALMRFVLKGNPQAGLPLLNGGTILGYLITYMIVYGNFGFGLTFSLF